MYRRRILLLLTLLSVFTNGLQAQIEADRADSFKMAGNYTEALIIYQSLIKTDSLKGNARELCKDYNNIANVYERMGSYDKSILFYFKALKIAEQQNDKKLEGPINYGIGKSYAIINQDTNAVNFINRAIEIFKANKSMNELANSYVVLGDIFGNKRDYDKAFSYFKMAEEIFKATNSKEELANTYVTIAYMELDQGNFNLVNEYSRKALLLFKEVNDKPGVATCYVNLQVALYYQNQDPKKPEHKKQMQNCITLLDSAYLAIKDIKTPEHFLTIYQNKAELYNLIGKNDSAYYYLQKHKVLNDSIYNITKNKQIEELKIQYEAGKKEQDILLLEKENAVLAANSERKTYLNIAAFTGVGFVTALLLLVVVRNRSRKKQKQVEFEKSILEFEQQALRAQMNPHFIFNAINSIQNFILQKNEQEAYDYLAKFAKLIRIVLNNSQAKELMLEQELEMIKLYVELEQLRFSNSFEFNLTVHEGVNEIEIAVPTLLIQPYLENAIWHGLMNLENERKGILNVGITQSKDILRICIIDNGIGREKAKQYKSEDKHRSVGMALTEQRLLMINKMQEYENAKVVVTDLINNKGEAAGTMVEIFIPVK